MDYRKTEKRQNASYKLNTILGFKCNHQNSYSHNFLVPFQNIYTKFIEIIEIPPEIPINSK